MAEEIVRVISVQTGNSAKSINDLRKQIKALRKELDQATIGSEEFQQKLTQLTTLQKQYSQINSEIRERSKEGVSSMQKMARLGENLAKSYSALNAVMGLLSDGNEDVNKAMLKVQRTIQLIQGLPGIRGVIKEIPELINGFKKWLSGLDPIERKVRNITATINGIDGKKLNSLSNFKGGTVNIGDVSAKATAGGLGSGTINNIDTETRAYQDQVQVITALNQARDAQITKLENLNKARTIEAEALKKARDTYDSLQTTIHQQRVSISELTADLGRFKKNQQGTITDLKNVNTGEISDVFKISANLKKAESDMVDAENRLKALTKEIQNTEKAISNIDDQIAGVGKTASKAGMFFKNVFSTVGWTLLISTIISAIYAIGKWIGNIKTAAKEQKEFNKAIREGTAQGSAKAVVLLKELAFNYRKVGDAAEEKQKFIQQYADKIKETGIAVTDVNTADEVFINNTGKYVNALMIRAKAQATENYAIKKYEEYLNERQKLEEDIANPSMNFGQNVWTGYIKNIATDWNKAGDAGIGDSVVEGYLENNKEKAKKSLQELDTEMDEKLKKWFTEIANLNGSIAGIFDVSGSGDSGSGGSDKEKDKEDPLEVERQLYEQYLKDVTQYNESLKSAKQKELDEVNNYYNRLIAGEMLFGEEYQKYVEAREKAITDIENKYHQQELDEAAEAAERRIAEIDAEINRIRSRYDTSNLREPKEQKYQTNYRQSAITPFLGLGASWLNTYQSGSNINDQYNAQISYNNEILRLTTERIEQENALLQKQLEVEGITADKRMEIERTLAENKMALSDAVQENEEANLEAYKKVQEARQQALNSTLDVASNVMGGLASLYKANSERSKKDGESEAKYQKEKEKAFNAYKKLSIAQAIIDTYKSANEAYSAMASIPYVGPALGIAAAAAAVIAGIANVRRIQNESISTTTESSSISAPSALQTAPIEYTRQLVGDKELDELNNPIRCYVVENDITRVQNRVKVAEDNATF